MKNSQYCYCPICRRKAKYVSSNGWALCALHGWERPVKFIPVNSKKH